MRNDRGNAVVEFVVIGLIAQLVIFGFVIRLGSDFRSDLAASAIARQTLRAMQLSGQELDAMSIANQVVAVFGLPESSAHVSIRDACAKQGAIEVEVRVRGKNHVAKGFCSY